MQTIVAYRFTAPRSRSEILAAVNRVISHYSKLSKVRVRLEGVVGSQTGLFALVPERAPSNWPMWRDSGDTTVASAYVPIGWRKLLGDMNIQEGPLALAKLLDDKPERVAELAPPFALFSLHKPSGTVRIVNDGLGYGRVYEYDEPDATILSTRADAAQILLGTASTANNDGWKSLSGCGWFMGDLTPFAKVRHLAPGMQVCLESGSAKTRRRQYDAIGNWVMPSSISHADPSTAAAEELYEFAREVSELWDTPPTVHLSGGRDSRATAAAFVAAGSPARFHTVASLQGELDVATQLLQVVDREGDHSIVREKDTSTSGNIIDRASSLQLAYGGVYGPAGVKQSMFQGFGNTYPVVTGAAGEIARGNFYKGNFLKTIRAGGATGPRDRLKRLYAFHGGVRDGVAELVGSHIDRALEAADAHGVTDVSTLDYFYLVERLRRWSNASCKLGTLTPLATPSYIRGAFSQEPETKLDEHYHLGIISKLVPAWKDIPFYKARPEDNRSRTRPWMWNSGDRPFAETVVHDPEPW
ncbi:hypothetical protein [Agrococcus casei]|uniref:hypothetical protein n=1 Tax=Agrococcus casei TaxID=343512 RepID=UPI003F93B658